MDKEIINIYCDESCHLEHDGVNTMALGCVWCKETDKNLIFNELRDIKERYGLKRHCEIKWNGVSPSKKEYFAELINYFFNNDKLHARVLIVPQKNILSHTEHNQTHDEFYYKMYFDLLKTIIDPQNSYNIFIDIKDTRGSKKIARLWDVLKTSNYDFDNSLIRKIQQVMSSDIELIGLADFFTGAICYYHRLHNGEQLTSETKTRLIDKIKEMSGKTLLKSTLYRENKLNIFVWHGGK